MTHPDPSALKNGRFLSRLGFALAGIRTVARREKSFRTQACLGLAALAAAAWLRPPLEWIAMLVLASALVLALEAVNGAIEYLADHIHPGHAEEVGRAKDAAAGAVLIASAGAAAIAVLTVAAALAR